MIKPKRSNYLWSLWLILALSLWGLSACSGGGGGGGVDLTGRQTEFVSATNDAARSTGDFYAAADGAAAPEAAEDEDKNADTTAEANREIVEADIINLEGNYLYLLNQYRGLIIVNIATPDAPAITGRLRISGPPQEMYIREGRAYIIISQAPQPVYRIMEDTASSDTAGTSRIEVVNISNPAAPASLGSYELSGQVTDSRLVGDVIYLVSTTAQYYMPYDLTVANDNTGSSGGSAATDTAAAKVRKALTKADGRAVQKATSDTPLDNISIISLNVGDPADIHVVDKEEFDGTANFIHVSTSAIFIAATSDYNYYNSQTEIFYVDISDPTGALAKRGSIKLDGQIQDEFKLDYYEDTLRVCAYQANDGGMSYLYTVDMQDPDEPELLATLKLGEGEQLFATRFDGPRGYMVTYFIKDPLHILDLSNPSHPKIKGELEVPGWSTHIEPRGDRLVALGVDDTSGRQVSVSLYDVSDPDNPKRLDIVTFGDSSSYSYSSAYNDIHAFTILDDLGLILLPYSSDSYSDGIYRVDSRLQLIDYSADALKARGSVSQRGDVLRSRSFTDRLFSVSTDELQVINAADRDRPQVTAKLSLARNVADFVALANNTGVQVIMEASGDYSLRAVPLSDPDADQALSQVDLDTNSYTAIFADGNLCYVVYNVYIYDEDAEYYGEDRIYIDVYDFTDAAAPKKRGALNLAGSFYTPLYAGASNMVIYPFSNSSAVLKLTNPTLVLYSYEQRYYLMKDSVSAEEDFAPTSEDTNSQKFSVVDLSDPDHPKLAVEYPLDIENVSGVFARGNTVYFSYYQDAGTNDNGQQQSKYFLGRIDFSAPENPESLPPVNIPGICVGLSQSSNTIYTMDSTWNDYYSLDYTFNALKLDDDAAYLLDSIILDDQSSQIIITETRAYLVPGYYYYYYRESSGTSRPIVIINLSDPQNLTADPATFPNENYPSIGCAVGNKLFVSLTYGLGIYDTSNPEQLTLSKFLEGVYAPTRVEVADNQIYLPLGYYGVVTEPF